MLFCCHMSNSHYQSMYILYFLFTDFTKKKLFIFVVTEYFKGNNWRVHPDWVYCEYNSGSGGEQWFRTPEERVLHFLSRTKRPGWKWMSLRPRSPLQRDSHLHQNINKQEKDSYFCE